jgi:hypothetical protein
MADDLLIAETKALGKAVAAAVLAGGIAAYAANLLYHTADIARAIRIVEAASRQSSFLPRGYERTLTRITGEMYSLVDSALILRALGELREESPVPITVDSAAVEVTPQFEPGDLTYGDWRNALGWGRSLRPVARMELSSIYHMVPKVIATAQQVMHDRPDVHEFHISRVYANYLADRVEVTLTARSKTMPVWEVVEVPCPEQSSMPVNHDSLTMVLRRELKVGDHWVWLRKLFHVPNPYGVFLPVFSTSSDSLDNKTLPAALEWLNARLAASQERPGVGFGGVSMNIVSAIEIVPWVCLAMLMNVFARVWGITRKLTPENISELETAWPGLMRGWVGSAYRVTLMFVLPLLGLWFLKVMGPVFMQGAWEVGAWIWIALAMTISAASYVWLERACYRVRNAPHVAPVVETDADVA